MDHSGTETLRETLLHTTVLQDGKIIKYAIGPKGQASLLAELNYAESFSPLASEDYVMPAMTPGEKTEDGLTEIRMPFYPGEAMRSLREFNKEGDNEGTCELFRKILSLATNLRTRYPDTQKKLKRETGFRLSKYALSFLKHSTTQAVSQVLNREKRQSFMDCLRCLQIASSQWSKFPYFEEEYQIHGCLHLEHIRISKDGKLVPIDFEHGAEYPRRLKYEDEAYIFQNLLQTFPNSDLAERFLKQWFDTIGYFQNQMEKTHADIAITQKLLGGIYELLTQPKNDRHDAIIKCHRDMLLRLVAIK